MWDNSQHRWAGTSKERIQQQFAEGQLKVLLCTEASGEGLNLQNCGVVINYDMPWNPMKVEQRIGRVDRIGQRRREVFGMHFFYERTVEAQVYRALGERIGWFETVVGELQPILQRAHTAIQRIAMVSPDERDPLAEEELAALAQEYQPRQARARAFISVVPGPKSRLSGTVLSFLCSIALNCSRGPLARKGCDQWPAKDVTNGPQKM